MRRVPGAKAGAARAASPIASPRPAVQPAAGGGGLVVRRISMVADDPAHSPRHAKGSLGLPVESEPSTGSSNGPGSSKKGPLARKRTPIGAETGERAEITQRELVDFRRMFQAFDRGSNGELDREEMGNVLRCLGVITDEDEEEFQALLT
eukprot:gene27661-59011_t